MGANRRPVLFFYSWVPPGGQAQQNSHGCPLGASTFHMPWGPRVRQRVRWGGQAPPKHPPRRPLSTLYKKRIIIKKPHHTPSKTRCHHHSNNVLYLDSHLHTVQKLHKFLLGNIQERLGNIGKFWEIL